MVYEKVGIHNVGNSLNKSDRKHRRKKWNANSSLKKLEMVSRLTSKETTPSSTPSRTHFVRKWGIDLDNDIQLF